MTQAPTRPTAEPWAPHGAAARHPATQPGLILLAAVGWSVAAAGGTRTTDLAISTALAGAALGCTGARWNDVRRAVRSPLGLAVVALVAWSVVVGLTTVGPVTTAVRIPWLVVVVVLASAATSRLTEDQRSLVTGGLVAIGVVVAASAVLAWVAAVRGGEALPVRAATVLGYANAAGVLLVATGLVTLHLHRVGRLAAPPAVALVGLQLLGVLATGSRLALLLTLVAACLVAWRRRTAVVALTASVVTVPVVALLVQRFATSPPQRLRLWAGALPEVAAHPLAGRGPAPEVLTASLQGRPTTHVHDELLQLGVEYGLVGLTLALLALGLLVVLLRQRRLVDPFLGLACVALASAALTDFALRIPAVALVLAVLVPLSWRRRPAR